MLANVGEESLFVSTCTFDPHKQSKAVALNILPFVVAQNAINQVNITLMGNYFFITLLLI